MKTQDIILRNIQPILIAVVVVLLNIASTTLFFRIDLTENRVYSLSEASKRVVADLEEPLTIKGFFSKNLPAPYNNVEQAVRDMLQEYSRYGGRMFNYTISTVDVENATDERVQAFEDEANSYRIYPINLQNVERDEVKLQTAYVGLSFIHGDMMETIPAITSTDNLEYRVTTVVDKMQTKTSALLGLEEDIQVRLVLSSSLYALGEQVEEVPADVEDSVSELNKENYGRLSFRLLDPDTDPEGQRLAREYGLSPLTLRATQGDSEAYAGVIVQHGQEAFTLNLFVRDLFGVQMRRPADIYSMISDSTESLLDINRTLGYLNDYGAPELSRNPQQRQQQQTPNQPNQPQLNTFNRLASETYTFDRISLSEEEIPEGLESMLIIGPQEQLDDYALYQLDQFLVNGGNLIVFQDAFNAYFPQDTGQFGAQPTYQPRETGLEDLLAHYGVELRHAYVLDEHCFVQRQQTAQGGAYEQPIYIAPLVPERYINEDLPFMRNMGELIFLNVAPLQEVADRLDGNTVTATQVLTSTDTAWQMADTTQIYQSLYAPPPPEGERQRYPLAYMLAGEFQSYFVDKEIPDPPEPEEDAEAEDERLLSEEQIQTQAEFVERGTGRVFVVGSTSILGDNVIGEEFSPNATFILNVLDAMNNRVDYAIMRSKGQTYNPLAESEPGARTATKTFNIAGLPALVVLAGVLVWITRIARKRKLRSVYGDQPET
jgi:ABC-type uncharacterized transport system involved in gliding motility auxiliary subunit